MDTNQTATNRPAFDPLNPTPEEAADMVRGNVTNPTCANQTAPTEAEIGAIRARWGCDQMDAELEDHLSKDANQTAIQKGARWMWREIRAAVVSYFAPIAWAWRHITDAK